MELIKYSFVTSDKSLLENRLKYVKEELIPTYRLNGYNARIIRSKSDLFCILTNCPDILDTEPLGNSYSYYEVWQNVDDRGFKYARYKNGKLHEKLGA